MVFVEEELRYVGQTWSRLKGRLSSHLKPAKKDKTYRANLFRKIRRLGLRVRIQAIQEGLSKQKDLDACERYWIQYFRGSGCRLVNSTDGGYGGKMDPGKVRDLALRRAGLSKEDEENICGIYPLKNTLILAKEFGVSPSCISHILTRNGIAVLDRFECQGGIKEGQQSVLAALYKRGLSAPQIALKYNTSSTVVYGILKRHGVVSRTSAEALARLDTQAANAAFRKYVLGKSIKQIASEAGVSESAVRTAFRRRGCGLKKGWGILSSDGTKFSSIEEVAAHYGMKLSSARAAFSKKIGGVTLSRVPPPGISKSFYY